MPASLISGLPKYTFTGAVTASGLEGDGIPAVTFPPVVVPNPVAYIVSFSSRLPGLSLLTRLPSACRISGPSASTNTAGAYFATVRVAAADAPCPVNDLTTTGYFPAASVGGSWALIWPADFASNGSGALLSVTQAPPSVVGRGVVFADAVVPRFRPMMEIKPFGATAPWKFAVLTIPLLAICGAFAVETVSSGMTLIPEAVSTNAAVPAALTAIARPWTFRRAPVRTIVVGDSIEFALAVVRCVFRSMTSSKPASVAAALAAVTGVEKRAKLCALNAATAATGRPVATGPPRPGSPPPPTGPVVVEPIGTSA